MRQRTTGLVAIGAGVFFLVTAGLLRFYAVPTLEVVPKDYWSHYTATGTGTVLDTRDGSTKTDAALTQDITIKGNLDGLGRPAHSVVWDYATELSFANPSGPCDPTPGGKFTAAQCPVSFSNERVALDDHTAAVKDWSGDKVDTASTQDAGAQLHHPAGSYISKFPFDMSKTKSYPLWDGISGTAPPAQYAGSTKINGLTVWKYVQTIGTPTAPVHIYDEPKLPAALVGDIAQDGKNVPVYEYSVTTALVDPVSGIPIAGDQKVRLTAGSLDGTDTNRLSLLDADLKLDRIQKTDGANRPQFDAQGQPIWVDYTAQSVRDAKAADRITLIKTALPLIGLILGLLLLALGVLLTIRAAAAESGPAGDPAPPSTEPETEAEAERTKTLPAVEQEEPERTE